MNPSEVTNLCWCSSNGLEHLITNQKVVGSTPTISTNFLYPPMFQGLGELDSKSDWVSSILTVDAIFSNTLGEGSERSLIGKTTAYEQKTFSSNLNQ